MKALSLIVVSICCATSLFAEDPFGDAGGFGGAVDRPVSVKKTVSKAAVDPAAAELEKKLKGIIIPRLEFQNASLTDGLAFLAASAKENNDGKAINFVMVGMGEFADEVRITLSLENIPLYDCIRYMSEIAGIKFRIDAHAVVIGNLQDPEKE